MKSSIIEDYKRNIGIYNEFTDMLESLTSNLIRDKGIQVHSVNSRTKNEESLKNKIGKDVQKYKAINDITDIVGLRIITYYEDQVDQVARIISKEFDVDVENSIDKRKLLDPDRFGYLSLHYVISLSKSRARLTENKQFCGLKAEVQIRTILQHAWAEIEHDLGYKTELAIPKEIRRDFSRLAGLFEIADSEFKRIRDYLDNYNKHVKNRIKHEPEKVLLDKVSLLAFIQHNPIIKHLISEMKNNKYKVVHSLIFPDLTVARLIGAGINNIADLNSALNSHQLMTSKIMIQDAKRIEEDYGTAPLYYVDYIILILCIVVICDTADKNALYVFINKNKSALKTVDEVKAKTELFFKMYNDLKSEATTKKV